MLSERRPYLGDGGSFPEGCDPRAGVVGRFAVTHGTIDEGKIVACGRPGRDSVGDLINQDARVDARDPGSGSRPASFPKDHQASALPAP